MTCEKGKVKHFFRHPLPKNKIIFWDTNFVLDVLFSPDSNIISELKQKRIQERLNHEEEVNLKRLEYNVKKHDSAVAFVELLIKQDINIAFSSILFTEVYFGLKYIELGKVFGNDRKKIKEELAKDPVILKDHIENIVQNWNLFLELLTKFKNRVFPINPSETEIIKETLRVRTTYKISPNDSLHIGTLLVGHQKDIVVFDKRFGEVCIEEGINVWRHFY